MRIYSADEVWAAAPMPAAIAAMRSAFIALSEGQATVPLRSALPVSGGVTLTMPAYIHGAAVSAVKVVSVCAGNPARGLPVVVGGVLVLDAETGVPLALLDGAAVTAIRTGAASGLATDLLARVDASALGVIGAGVQARTQIEAVCAVRPIKTIRIYSPNNALALVEELRGRYPADIQAVGGAAEAVEGADIIVTATNSATPVFPAEAIKPGTHINGVGSYTHTMQEVPAEIVAQARLVVDHLLSAWAEAGDLIIARDSGLIDAAAVVEIGAVAAGRAAGRVTTGDITFFKSVGNAVQDAALAELVLTER